MKPPPGDGRHAQTAEQQASLQNYLRKWQRQKVSVPAKFDITLDHDGKKFSTGTAIVRNISLSGALLGRVVIKKGVLPARRFKIHLAFNLREFKGVGAIARPVHFGHHEKEFELGVEFVDLWIGNPE